jgi:hypothetical protein
MDHATRRPFRARLREIDSTTRSGCWLRLRFVDTVTCLGPYLRQYECHMYMAWVDRAIEDTVFIIFPNSPNLQPIARSTIQCSPLPSPPHGIRWIQYFVPCARLRHIMSLRVFRVDTRVDTSFMITSPTRHVTCMVFYERDVSRMPQKLPSRRLSSYGSRMTPSPVRGWILSR